MKSLKDGLRSNHNVAVSEIDDHDVWQRAAVAAITVSADRVRAEQVLQHVEKEAASILGGMLAEANVEGLA